jgi:predicted secreted protein
MVALVEKDNDRTVAIRPGEILQITLPENATTGYR